MQKLLEAISAQSDDDYAIMLIEVLCLMSWSNNGVQLLNSHCLMLLLMLLMRNWRQPFFLRFISLPREDVMNQTESVQLRSK